MSLTAWHKCKSCFFYVLLFCGWIIHERETQDALGRWFYPLQKFRIFLKNNLDSRIGFFLGMESGGDVKFYSPGAPVRPHFSFSHRFSLLRSDGATRAEKFFITAWLHTQKEPYSAIQIIFKKYPEFLRGIKPTPERILGFPYVEREQRKVRFGQIFSVDKTISSKL